MSGYKQPWVCLFGMCCIVLTPIIYLNGVAWLQGSSEEKQAEASVEIIAPTVADLPLDSHTTASPEALVIDENKKVWLHKHQPVGGEGIVIFNRGGSYDVEIKDDKLKWLKIPLTDDIKKVLLPVRNLQLPKKK